MMLDNSNSYSVDTSHIKLRSKLGLGFIIASLFFLFNPDINVIDVFPDVFGYILICIGLSQLTLVNDYIAEAYSRFKKMILISAGKLASIIFIFGMTDAVNRPNSFLLFSFAFAVVDLIFLIPAYNDLFRGLQSLADRNNGKAVYTPKKEGGLCYAERIHIFTIAFIIIKSVSSTWPEFLSLATSAYTDSFVMYLYDYIGAFRIISAFPTAVIGSIWLLASFKFYTRVGNDAEFIDSVKATFARDILPKEGIFIKRAMGSALTVLVVGVIFCIDFPLGSVGLVGESVTEINVIPDFIAALLFLFSGIMLKHYIGSSKKLRIASAVYLGMTIAASIAKILFISRFDHFTAINKLDEAYYAFYGMCAVTVIENIAFVLTVVILTVVLRELIQKYTGYNAYSSANELSRVTSLQKELTNRLKYMIISAAICAVTAIAYEFLLPEKSQLAQYMWIIDLIAQATFAGICIKCFFSIKDEVDNKFMLEI